MDPEVFEKTLRGSERSNQRADLGLGYELVRVSGKRYFGAIDISKGIDSVFFPDGELKSKSVAVLAIEPKEHQDYNAVLYHNVPAEAFERNISRTQRKRGFFTQRIKLHGLNPWQLKSFGSNVPLTETGYDWRERIYTVNARKLLEVKKSQYKVTSYVFIRKDISPDLSYVERLRKATRFHGQEFEDAFLKTTFIADMQTTLEQALSKNLIKKT